MADTPKPVTNTIHTDAPTTPAAIGVVRGYDDLVKRMLEQGWWMVTPRVSFPAHWLHQGEQRLDAGYYADLAFRAQHAVLDSKYEVKPLGDEDVTREVYILGRFRRIYARNREAGWPYLGASDSMTFRPESDRWIAKDHAPKHADRHFAHAGWILVSSSGSVGRVALVTERLERYFLTHDLIRIVPNDVVPSGYLYAYLSTWVGQALVSKDQYGSAIKHLEPHHVAAVPVPLLPEKQQRDVHEMVVTAYKLRDEANALLDEGDEMLHHELGLPQFDESLVPYLPTPTTEIANGLEVPHPRAFSIKASDLAERFDASYHVPVARSAIAILQKSRYAPVRLGRMVDNIFIPPRFKRIYVSAQYGIPFLRPSQIPQMRPYDLGYLSRKTEELEELLLHKGDVLVTTDGTVGRVALVSSRIAGWAGSNNIARITYGTENNRNGYVAAFLSSPYGFHQLTREIYGGVVDHIEVPHIAGTWIPDAPPELQEEIGKLVVEAYEKKDMASAIEEAAISRVEAALTGEQDTSSGLHGTS